MLVTVLSELREPGRDPGITAPGSGMRKDSGGGLFLLSLFNRGPGLVNTVLGGLELGAVLGLSTLSSRSRGMVGGGASWSEMEAESNDSCVWLKSKPGREGVSTAEELSPAAAYASGSCKLILAPQLGR